MDLKQFSNKENPTPSNKISAAELDPELEAELIARKKELDSTAQKRFRFIRASEFLKNPCPIQWIIKHWVQDKALMMIHGPSGSKKSFLALDWAMHIATGKSDWMGHKVKPGLVTYMAGEGIHGIRGRIAAWAHYHSEDDLSNLYFSQSACDFNREEDFQEIREALNALPENPTLVIIDTLHQFFDGDENSARDSKTMLRNCSEIMFDYDCTVILIHHTAKNTENHKEGRGSSAWKAALDLAISVRPNGDYSIVEQTKSKDSPIAPAISIDLESIDIPNWFDEDGEAVTSAVVVKAESNQSSNNKLSTNESWALNNFIEAAQQYGELDSDGKFAGLHLDDWRGHFYKKHAGESDDTKRKAFNRGRTSLVNKQKLDVNDNVYRLSGIEAGIIENQIISEALNDF